MRKIGLLMIWTLVPLVAGAAWAGGPAFPATERAAVASTTAVPTALPDGLVAQLTPKPENKIAYVGGPCTAEVTCIDDYTISCSGLSYCMWRADRSSPSFPSYRGFVECDGLRTTCTTIE
jgi:hypothetical protein